MSHPVVLFLADHPISALSTLGIKPKWSTVNPRKFALNYDQIEAVDGDPLVNLCRGLVLRQLSGERGEAGEYEVLARPFPRFYNLGSGHCPPMDWTTATFEEKLDGTLCIVYFDPDLDRWCVGTRNVPDADHPTNTGVTFAELFIRHCTGWEKDETVTYCFELTGPDNQIVVPYDAWTTTLLAAIETKTGRESPGVAPRHPFATLPEAQEWLSRQPGHAIEGFVVRDAAGNRVKVKSAQYLAVSRVMTASGSDTGLVEIVLSGTADDVRAFLPLPRQARMDAFAVAVRDWAASIEVFALGLKEYTTDRKTAALAVQASPFAGWMGPILDIWTGKSSAVSAWLGTRKRNGVIPDSIIEKITEAVKGEVCP